MKIASVKIKDFKGFTELDIENLGPEVKLVVLVGPNGSGKSSILEALKFSATIGMGIDRDLVRNNFSVFTKYYHKNSGYEHRESHFSLQEADEYLKIYDYHHDGHLSFLDSPVWNSAQVKLHKSNNHVSFRLTSIPDKNIHFRPAYRRYDKIYNIQDNSYRPIMDTPIITTSVEEDNRFGENYITIISWWLELSSECNSSESSEKILKPFIEPFEKLFLEGNLKVKNLGNPKDGGFFQFTQGNSKRFSFSNLSNGEKAVLDLLLDLFVTREKSAETIICIDEPEQHINVNLQGPLLREMYNLVSDSSQLWISTHSIGMVKEAQKIFQEDSNKVVFLDLSDINPSEQVTLIPSNPNRAFFEKLYKIILDDFADLLNPEIIIFCEGDPEDNIGGLDSYCYNLIFQSTHPNVKFFSVGGKKEVEKFVKAQSIIQIIEKVEVYGVVDKDTSTEKQILRKSKKGIWVLSRKMLESYLIDNEIIIKFCNNNKIQNKISDLIKLKQNLIEENTNPKGIVSKVWEKLKNENFPVGDDIETFKIDCLVPLITPDTNIYKELEKDIFSNIKKNNDL